MSPLKALDSVGVQIMDQVTAGFVAESSPTNAVLLGFKRAHSTPGLFTLEAAGSEIVTENPYCQKSQARACSKTTNEKNVQMLVTTSTSGFGAHVDRTNCTYDSGYPVVHFGYTICVTTMMIG